VEENHIPAVEHRREDIAQKDTNVKECRCVKDPLPRAALQLIDVIEETIIEDQQGEANKTSCHCPEQLGCHDRLRTR
jgi:hypothetical protein